MRKREKSNSIINLCVFFICCHFSFGQLHLLSDEFNNSTLDSSWNLFQDQFFTTPVPVSNGFMQMDLDNTLCSPTCVWWKENNAGLIYKSVTGNFDVTTAVYAKQKTDLSLDITNDFQLTGLMVRDPASTSSGLENYVFNVAGIRGDVPSIELKSTLNDISTIKAYTDNMTTGTSAELRIVREGSVFSLYSRPIGNTTWAFRDSFNRPDLPNTLQVGLIAYTYEAYPANLLAQFDYIRFKDVTVLNIEDGFNINKIKIYQSAAKKLHIKGVEKEKTTITLFNILGKKLSEQSFQFQNKIEFILPNLHSGIYIVQLKTSNGSLNKKVFINQNKL